jgi:hypothetical protein
VGLLTAAKGLLERAFGRARVERARWILALDELHRHVTRPWVTLAEFTEAFYPSAAPSFETTKGMWSRLQRALRELGIEAQTITPEGDGRRMFFATPEIRALVKGELEEAQEIVTRIGSQDVDEVQAVAHDYWMFSASLEKLARKRRVHARVIRRLVALARRPIRPRGRPRIELRRPSVTIALAHRAVFAGWSVTVIAKILNCSRSTAREFRDRVMRSERPAG